MTGTAKLTTNSCHLEAGTVDTMSYSIPGDTNLIELQELSGCTSLVYKDPHSEEQIVPNCGLCEYLLSQQETKDDVHNKTMSSRATGRSRRVRG